jgi:cysteine-S-conjugate beta-lyase
VRAGRIVAKVPLPVAGLMSGKRARDVAAETTRLKRAWKAAGCTLPYMGFNLIPLSVIPEIRITDRGLVTVPGMRISPLSRPPETTRRRRGSACKKRSESFGRSGSLPAPMKFDFDTPRDRRGTDSQKWQRYAGRDVLPMWVADMDFEVAPPIVEAIRQRVAHGIFGYARPVHSTVDAVIGALATRYRWQVDPSWIVWLPGLVCGLNVTVRAFAEAGDEVLCMSPVYAPFMTAPRNGGRAAKNVPLALNSGERRWEIDWGALEQAVTPRTKLFLFCHPHNPVARVWRRDEIERIAEFCARHHLVLVSDDIHCDLLLEPGAVHEPFCVAAPAEAARTVTLMAPSKTFNTPGLGTSFAIIPEPALRARFARASAGIVAEVNALGYAACEAAYRDGEPWRQALVGYLRGNRDFLSDFISREIPGIRIEAPIEATYLAWLNVEKLGLPSPAKHFESHGVGLSDGAPFGAPPGTHVRLNFGCPRSTLAEGLARMKAAVRAT